MKIKDLIKKLEQYNPESEILTRPGENWHYQNVHGVIKQRVAYYTAPTGSRVYILDRVGFKEGDEEILVLDT